MLIKTFTKSTIPSTTCKRGLKTFSSIPGPSSLPLVGTLYKYFPIIGKYKFDELHHNGFKKFEEYGPVVREEIVPGVNIVWLFDPDDIEIMFRCEGKYPQRRSHLALQKFRLDRPNVYNTGGLLPTDEKIRKQWCKVMRRDEISPISHLHCCEDHFNTSTVYKELLVSVKLILKRISYVENFSRHIVYPADRNRLPLVKQFSKSFNNGPDWYKIRKIFQKGLSGPVAVKRFLKGSDDIISEWLERLESLTKKPNLDYLPELSRLFLELTGYAALDLRLHSFAKAELHRNSRSSKLINAALVTNSCILKLDNGPQLWKLFDTLMYRKLKKSQLYMEE